MEDSSSEGSQGSQNPLLGFLFGNVDEGNRVDADYLDEVRSRSADNLGTRLSGG
jgi:hypothetical protein